ncbi:MAG TPA: 1-acyl-sn-glycerol-3-phosphate acyltransferase [Bacteroidia bacterium]|nr:1-acyl-sn-glycerol-3-phosphate acyltransferase [Bacteroidia bacterium]
MIVLYMILRLMVRVTLRIFYKEFTVNGRERLPRKGPLIVVANHPNTLMDPLIVASLLHQMAGFMGNGSLFRNKPLAKLLRFFNVIPVYRKQDIRPGENIDNQDNFEHARAYLGEGGTLLIFPEGTSYAEKKLRDLRTGAARIAMSYESAHDFQGGLVVMPLALNYTAPTRSRTRIRIDVGEPIPVSKFADIHRQDNFEAVRALTEEVRQQIASRMVVLDDKEQETLLSQVTRLMREQHKADDRQHKGHPALLAERNIADKIRSLKLQDSQAYARLRDRFDKWFAMMDKLQIREGFFRQSFQKWNGALLWVIMLLFLVLTAPAFVFGMLTNWLPYWFPGWVAPKISDEIEYHAPIMMVLGMFLFPIWYALLLVAACLAAGIGGWWLAGLGLLLPVTGMFALVYAQVARRFAGLSSLLHIKGKKRSILQALQDQRDQLLDELEKLLGMA